MRLLVSLARLFAVLTAAVLAAFLAAVIYSAALPGGKFTIRKKSISKIIITIIILSRIKTSIKFFFHNNICISKIT